ncbi:hypothetical protein EHQ76_07115 [Leptospira barantonii]|uniref:Uncharacterized protein n=1 Tax=Leptospira barantonii TaxID=2023184 RepID=A0A5F2BGW2_9LEPT|nr:hypothetical protein [Leptospira barantonii]TGM04811.1 hypothetical protein EHQ76_07115 [Leptospira barantonii]
MQKPKFDYKFNDETIAALFGHEAADREDVNRLKQYYFKKSDYESVTSNLPLKIVIGFKGVGKSAVLKIAYQEDIANSIPCIWIRPDDISEIYSDLTKESNDLRLITLWKKGISRVIAMHLVESMYLSVNEESDIAVSWAEQHGYKSRDLLSQLVQRLKPIISKKVDIERPNVSNTFGEHHLLDRLVQKKKIRIYIDDLDRGWKASKEDITRLAALINALGDLTTDVEGLQVRLALRGDVYSLVRGASEFTDKFESSEVWCNWTNHEILVALIKRIYTYFNIDLPDDEILSKKQHELNRYLDPIFATKYLGSRAWENAPMYRVIMSLIRRRPRDMVKLSTNAAKKANEEKSKTITGKHMSQVLEHYSNQRMKDIIIEFQSELPNISDLLYNMGPTSKEIHEKRKDRYLYTTEQLYKKVSNVMMNVPIRFTNNVGADFHDVSYFLFKIGFITATKKLANGFVERKFYEDKPQLLSKSVGDEGYSWEIHPAYRSALFKRTNADEKWEESINLENVIDEF